MFPKFSSSDDTSLQLPPWWAPCVGLIILAAFITAGWYAGHRSGTIQQSRLNNELLRLTQELATTKLSYETTSAQLQAANAALRSSGQNRALTRQRGLQQQLLKSQADAEACREIIDRQQLSLASHLSMVDTLSQRNVRLLPMKEAAPAASSIAYIVLIPNRRVIFVGSGLPALPKNRQLELWVVRRQDPKIVSAGLLSPAGGTAVLQFSNAALISELESVAVTEEPLGGSPVPTGTKLFTATISALS